MTDLSRVDEHDNSGDTANARAASAEAVIVLSQEAFAAAISGDAFAAARIAGIMAAKKTSELIPLSPHVPLREAAIAFEPLAERNAVRIAAMVKTDAQTGAEMEALTAASIAALTIYDMVKALGKGAEIESIRLLTNPGGKSSFHPAPERTPAARRSAPAARSRATPAVLAHEAAPARPLGDASSRREAFRTFMTSRQLRATDWAKRAGVPASIIYSYLTGRSRGLTDDAAERLASAAQARVEDLFGGRGPR